MFHRIMIQPSEFSPDVPYNGSKIKIILNIEDIEGIFSIKILKFFVKSLIYLKQGLPFKLLNS